jgi:cobalt-zinc-cadmium efflux system membrane fusion protein
VTQDDLARAARALALTPRAENNSKCGLHERRIQFASAEAAQKAGVEVEPVWTAAVVEAVTANGEITYDPTRTARLSPRVPGSVFRVFKQVGDPVKAGEVVALVDAAEVGKAKAAFLTALVQARLAARNYDRVKGLASASPKEVDEAFAAHTEARIAQATAQQALTNLGLPVDAAAFDAVANDDLPDRLRFLGVPKAAADALDAKVTTGNLLPVVAPQDGLVATRNVVAGEVVGTDKVLMLVVDPARMWLTLDVGQADAALVKLGQEVRFRPTAGREGAGGRVVWMSTEVNDRTRTVKVRAEVENPDGRLRSNTFGTGRVILREEAEAVVVPASALHWEGDCHIVFVRDKDYLKPGSPKVFHTRTVRPGVRDGTQVEIIAGVLPGEVVAAKGSGTLRAELLRGNLGEG